MRHMLACCLIRFPCKLCVVMERLPMFFTFDKLRYRIVQKHICRLIPRIRQAIEPGARVRIEIKGDGAKGGHGLSLYD